MSAHLVTDEPRDLHDHLTCAIWTTNSGDCDCKGPAADQTAHDLRCPELADPEPTPDPTRCLCRDAQGHAPRIDTAIERAEIKRAWHDMPLCALDRTAAKGRTA